MGIVIVMTLWRSWEVFLLAALLWRTQSHSKSVILSLLNWWQSSLGFGTGPKGSFCTEKWRKEQERGKASWCLIEIHWYIQNQICSLRWLQSFCNNLLPFHPLSLHCHLAEEGWGLFGLTGACCSAHSVLTSDLWSLSYWHSQPPGPLDSWGGFQDWIETIWIYDLFQSRADLAWQSVGCDKQGIPEAASFQEAYKYCKDTILFCNICRLVGFCS